jgi:hypothetical protein
MKKNIQGSTTLLRKVCSIFNTNVEKQKNNLKIHKVEENNFKNLKLDFIFENNALQISLKNLKIKL